MKILLIEDEVRLAKNICTGLRQEGYVIDMVHDGLQGLDLAQTGEYDLLILDLMLPSLGGLDISKKLRSEKINTPILMLTAKSTLDDKVLGLNTGADDYLTKPFDFEELLARIKALLRRPLQYQPEIITKNNFTIDTKNQSIFYKNKEILLSQKEYQVLEFLVKNTKKWVAKEELISRVWSYESEILENTVEATIKNIRKKTNKSIILTKRGFGYRLSS